MASYYTKAEARGFASAEIQKSATRDSRRILREAVQAATNEDSFDIFLSHASHDSGLILGVKGLSGLRNTLVIPPHQLKALL